MAIVINGNGIDMGNNPVSNVSQIDSVVINENSENVATTSNLVGFKNYIINGNFDIWQRGTSQTSAGYGSDDRWNNEHYISTKTHSRVSCTDTERELFNASYFSRTVTTYVSGTNSYIKKIQSIENITRLAGKTVTISFWAKADSNKKMNVQVVDVYGSGGTPTVSSASSIVNFGNVDLTSTWTKYKLTATLPSLVGKTLGTDGVHTSFFRLDFGFTFSSDRHEVTLFGMPVGQSGTFDIAQVQLEEGSVATPFEQRPIGLELSLCQRYYEVGRQPNIYMNNVSCSAAHDTCFFNVEKRVTPSITTNFFMYYSVGVPTNFQPVISSILKKHGFIFSSYQFTNWNGWDGAGSWTADAEL